MSAPRTKPGEAVRSAVTLIAAAQRKRTVALLPPAKLAGPNAKRRAAEALAAKLRARAHRSILRKP